MSALLKECEDLVRQWCADGEMARVLVEDEFVDGKKPLESTGLPVRYPVLYRAAQAFVSKNHSSKPPLAQRRCCVAAGVKYDSAVAGAQGAATEEALTLLRTKLKIIRWDEPVEAPNDATEPSELLPVNE
jgi:hypothetical protein